MSTTQATSTEVCDGENLAIILALYWVIYLICNAVIFAGVMYGLRKCLGNDNSKKSKAPDDPTRPSVSRASSQRSLISRGKQ